MGLIARKNLLEQPFRLLAACGGVAFAAVLILVLWAILAGTLGQAGALVRNTDAQVWVVQKGFTDLAHGFSVLPASLERRVEAVPGVRDANPITVGAMQFRVRGEKRTLLVVGYDTRTGVGGPWAFAGGRRVPRAGEVVVDETFARTSGVRVGDTLFLPDRPRRVVALSSGTNQFTNQLAFADIRDARGLVRLRKAVNFYAVRVQGRPAAGVLADIRRTVPGVTAFSKPAFLANNKREIEEGFKPILYVMVAIAFGVGLIVVALTMYTMTVEKSREYGALAAIGAGRRALAGVVLRQAAMTAALGFALGCALVVPMTWLVREVAPKTELDYSEPLFAVVGGAALLMGLLASYVPTRRLASLDPAAVFRA